MFAHFTHNKEATIVDHVYDCFNKKEDLFNTVTDHLTAYNATNAEMNLVLFDDAL